MSETDYMINMYGAGVDNVVVDYCECQQPEATYDKYSDQLICTACSGVIKET